MNQDPFKIFTEGEVIEIFPFDDPSVEPGHYEALVYHEEVNYHILLSPDKQPIKINHVATEADYDMSDYDLDDWDITLSDGLWEEEE